VLGSWQGVNGRKKVENSCCTANKATRKIGRVTDVWKTTTGKRGAQLFANILETRCKRKSSTISSVAPWARTAPEQSARSETCGQRATS